LSSDAKPELAAIRGGARDSRREIVAKHHFCSCLPVAKLCEQTYSCRRFRQPNRSRTSPTKGPGGLADAIEGNKRPRGWLILECLISDLRALRSDSPSIASALGIVAPATSDPAHIYCQDSSGAARMSAQFHLHAAPLEISPVHHVARACGVIVAVESSNCSRVAISRCESAIASARIQ
jgi:hypothetical protein